MFCDRKLVKSPRAKLMYGDRVKFHGRTATIVEVVPPGGRPQSKVPVTTLRAQESYVIRAPVPKGMGRGGRNGEYLTWPLSSQLVRVE